MGPINIISFVGYQGSGKSLLARKLARVLGTDFVDISDIVKRIHSGLSREQLATTGDLTEDDPTWLGKEVAVEIERICKEQDKRVAILAGVREEEVHVHLLKEGYHIWAIKVFASPAIRYRRLLLLEKIKHARAFIEQDLREKQLGLDKVLSATRLRIETSDDTDAEELARATKEHLQKKGAKF